MYEIIILINKSRAFQILVGNCKDHTSPWTFFKAVPDFCLENVVRYRASVYARGIRAKRPIAIRLILETIKSSS